MTSMETQGTKLDALRRHLQARREARLRRLSLERDLALYRSARDRDEMYAMLSRYEDTETVEIRSIVSRNLAA